jgi:hypothetical protein
MKLRTIQRPTIEYYIEIGMKAQKRWWCGHVYLCGSIEFEPQGREWSLIGEYSGE